MGHSGIVEFVYHVLPVRAWKAKLAGHMERCPACAGRLAGKDEVRGILVRAEDVGSLDGLWPSVRKNLSGAASGSSQKRPAAGVIPFSRPRPGGMLWRWAAALAGTALASFLTFSILRSLGPSAGPAGGVPEIASGGQFRLHYAKVQGRAADTYIFQSDGLYVVWVDRQL